MPPKVLRLPGDPMSGKFFPPLLALAKCNNKKDQTYE